MSIVSCDTIAKKFFREILFCIYQIMKKYTKLLNDVYQFMVSLVESSAAERQYALENYGLYELLDGGE